MSTKMFSKGAIEECRFLRFQGHLFSVPKKKLFGAASDPQLVTSEPIHQVQQIQIDNGFASEDPSTPWGFHLFTRSVRRILARTGGHTLPSFSGLRAGQEAVPVQSYAIRPQHCSTDLHEVNELYDKGSSTVGHSSCGIPG